MDKDIFFARLWTWNICCFFTVSKWHKMYVVMWVLAYCRDGKFMWLATKSDLQHSNQSINCNIILHDMKIYTVVFYFDAIRTLISSIRFSSVKGDDVTFMKRLMPQFWKEKNILILTCKYSWDTVQIFTEWQVPCWASEPHSSVWWWHTSPP